MRCFLLLLLVSSFGLLEGCDIVNPSEKVPTYVHIDSFQFVPTANTGTSSHRITHLWAYLDNVPIGAFDLPATIPLLADKPVQLRVIPGVMYSGLSDVLIPYPYYQTDTITVQPSSGNVISYTPKTSYFSDSILLFTHEDFESGNSFVHLEGDTLKRSSDPAHVFEGAYGGVINRSASGSSVNIMGTSFSGPVIAANKAEVYLELNYRGTLAFQIGVETMENGQVVTQFLYGFRARNEWTKVYIGLQDFLNIHQGLTYRVLVGIPPTEPANGFVAFDNFKVVSKE